MSNDINRTRSSIYNAVSSVLLTLVNGLLGIIVTKLIIHEYGSDFNGLNSTANQIINVLLILEGGFTLASNVALFEPVVNNDYNTINGILKATRDKFHKIAIAFAAIGVLVAGGYSFFAKTDLRQDFVFTVIFMTIFPQAVNLYYATTYRVLLQSQQKEYVINCFTAITIGMGHITNMFVVHQHFSMLTIRLVTMLFSLINSYMITRYTRRNNLFIDYNVASKPEMIKGTNDVMAQKITGVIYTSWPVVFLSISSSGGTKLASVYSVYNSVFVMIKALLHGVIDAPRLGFGQMMTKKSKDEIWPFFKDYEFIAFFFTFIMMSVSYVLILPFISLYTKGVSDINYNDSIIALLMVFISTIEMLHIPSGHIINMSGNFRISKYFQIVACILLVISMSVLGSFYGVYGMLLSLLLVAVLLAVLEIGYIHVFFFKNRLLEFIKMLLPYIAVGTVISYMETQYIYGFSSFGLFVFSGVLLVLINSIIGIVLSAVFNKDELSKMYLTGKSIVKKVLNSKRR